MKLREVDIKALLLSEMRSMREVSSLTIIADEYPVGKTGVRVDLALLDKIFVGVEIKSERDSLRRLSKQITIYRSVFDRVILVLAERHYRAIPQTSLANLEVWVLSTGGRLTQHKPPLIEATLDETVRASLLTKKEAQLFSGSEKGETSGEASSRDIFFDAFRHRYASTSLAFWRHVGRRKIKPEDLYFLSRFKGRRDLEANFIANRETKWSQWEPVKDSCIYNSSPSTPHQLHTAPPDHHKTIADEDECLYEPPLIFEATR